jgi:chaperone BCS1
MRSFGFQSTAIRRLLERAQSTYQQKTNEDIVVFDVSFVLPAFHQLTPRSESTSFSSPRYRTARPWESVILPGTIKEDLLRDVSDFISSEMKKWYTQKGQSAACIESDMSRHSAQTRVSKLRRICTTHFY